MVVKRVHVYCILVGFVAAFNLLAVDMPDEVPFEEGKGPPAANVGDGWCLVTIPACFKTVTRQQQVQPATHFFENGACEVRDADGAGPSGSREDEDPLRTGSVQDGDRKSAGQAGI